MLIYAFGHLKFRVFAHSGRASHFSCPNPETMISALTPLLPQFASLEWLETTGSSNADLMQRARQADATPLPWLLGADRQSSARGRAGRPWQNTPGATLMFSCAFAVDLPIAALAGLSPVMGIAACEALRTLLLAQASATAHMGREKRLQLKWPNDLLWDGAKLAGILVESATMPGSKTPVIVAGIGLNLKDATALSETLERPIADWSQIAQTGFVGAGSVGAGSVDASPAHAVSPEFDPAQIVASIAAAWLRAIAEYAAGGYAAFNRRFNEVDALAGHQVDVTDKGHILQTGQASGTDSTGRLLLQTDRGISAIMVGDVSIRPSAPYTATAHFASENQS